MADFSNRPEIVAGLRRQRATLDAARADGARLLGWKVGFGAPAALQKFTLPAPLTGYLLQGNERASGAHVDIAAWTKPAAEPEIAIRLGRDLRADASLEEARAAISAMAPAIELADVTFPPDDIAEILAGNIYQRHVICGPFDETRAGGRLDGVTGLVDLDGAVSAAPTDLESNTGRLVELVQHVGEVLPLMGERLRAGEIIIAGSVIPPIFLTPAHRALAFHLAPLGSVSVRLG